MTTGATLFSGGGGADIGMAAAGINMRWGMDNDPEVVAVARANFLPIQYADILTANPYTYEPVDFLHASPPCRWFSQANTRKGETEEDIALSRGVCFFIMALKPRFFTLENVSMYRKSESFARIMHTLTTEGYVPVFELVNFADMGVPQTRRRLILRAVRGGLVPPLPALVPWRGWYQAVADLLGNLPDTEFAPWQIARGVLDLVRETAMVAQGSFDHADAGNARAPQPLGTRLATEPSFTITGNSSMNGLRCYLVSPQNGRVAMEDDTRRITVRRGDRPAFTITASMSRGAPRAALPGRVVALTPRCGARLQTFPDWYELSGKNALDWRIIGNAVPPLAMQRLAEGLLRYYPA